MAKPFGPERGLIKTPLTAVGFISMYIFGGSIFSVLSGLTHLFTSRNVLESLMVYFFTEYLLPTSVEGVIGQVIAGTVVAELL